MKHWSIFLLASPFLLSLASPVQAGGKQLLPAFDKELVPDQQTEDRNASKDAQTEDEHRKRGSSGVKRHSAQPHGRIQIELDGEEDGGESGGDDEGL